MCRFCPTGGLCRRRSTEMVSHSGIEGALPAPTKTHNGARLAAARPGHNLVRRLLRVLDTSHSQTAEAIG